VNPPNALSGIDIVDGHILYLQCRYIKNHMMAAIHIAFLITIHGDYIAISYNVVHVYHFAHSFRQ
jgi:hypothetical protein